VTSLAKRRAIAAAILVTVALGAWYLGRPHVPAGQPPLVTLDTASVGALREAFNRDTDYVRIIILQSPT
jgi:hypothetical protein